MYMCFIILDKSMLAVFYQRDSHGKDKTTLCSFQLHVAPFFTLNTWTQENKRKKLKEAKSLRET